MNILLGCLQAVLALHTLMGAIWKISHSAEQTMPSLKAIPQGVWLGLSFFEVLCVLGLVLPVLFRSCGFLAPIAAFVVAAEMLLFCGVHFRSGASNYSPVIYWLGVAVVSVVVAYSRLRLRPL